MHDHAGLGEREGEKRSDGIERNQPVGNPAEKDEHAATQQRQDDDAVGVDQTTPAIPEDVWEIIVLCDGASETREIGKGGKRQGLIRHLGVSNVLPEQLAEAQKITDIACVQNFYNVANRNDDAFIDRLAKKGIGYVPFFPLGGFTPLQSSVLDRVAVCLQATPMQIALAWLLQRSPNILPIPGTSSINHLRQNLDAAGLELPSDVIAELNTIAKNAVAG